MKQLEARMQAIADGYIEQDLYAGIAWQVERAGSLIASGTSGTSDEERRASLGDDAIYRIYSMTKPVVSFMALMLVERGQLRQVPGFCNVRILCLLLRES